IAALFFSSRRRHTRSKRDWSSDVCSSDLSKPIDDIDEAVNILEKYNVQDWKEDYSYEDPSSYEDGYAWSLYLQFEDGTVERHKVTGSFAVESTPENYKDYY